MSIRKGTPHLALDVQEQLRAPLVEALLQYDRNRHASFHVPGHKDGHWYEQAGLSLSEQGEWSMLLQRMSQLLSIDVTEVEGTDDLHHPTGAIAEAQQLAAKLFGSEETHFLVGGSTVGNVALLMCCCVQPNDLVLVQRSVHKSVLHGLMMAGARAVFLTPQIDTASGLATAPTSEAVEQALQAYPEAKAVFVTNPNYYGMGIDLRQLAAITHSYNIPLLVDEAHGAHYGLHPAFPESALQAGADGVVQSTHKMLGGMTMSAMLHVQGVMLNRARLKKLLTMLQSSSPSYPLMASLDISRYYIARNGQEAFEEGLKAVQLVRAAMANLDAFEVIEIQSTHSQSAYCSLDPFKVTIRCREGLCSGYELLDQLALHGCIAEMADLRHTVLVFSLGSTLEDANRLIRALQAVAVTLDNNTPYTKIQAGTYMEITDASSHPIVMADGHRLFSEPVSFSIYEQEHVRTKQVLVQEAIGRKAAESVIPYPPGIPLLYPGEIITEDAAQQLIMLAHAGAKCHDAEDESLRTIRIVDTEEEKGIEE